MDLISYVWFWRMTSLIHPADGEAFRKIRFPVRQKIEIAMMIAMMTGSTQVM